MEIFIKRATAADVAAVAPLFDAYRTFYQQASAIEAAQSFLEDRLRQNQSTIFIAQMGDEVVGFVQLYPIFSSVRLKRAWLLNDLYVDEKARGKGVGEQLLNAAKAFAKTEASGWLLLQTAADNLTAQRLYERNGWQRESDYFYRFDIS